MGFEDTNKVDLPEKGHEVDQKKVLDFQQIQTKDYADFSRKLDANIKNLGTPAQINFGKQLAAMHAEEKEGLEKNKDVAGRLNAKSVEFNKFLAANSKEGMKDLGTLFETTSKGIRDMLFSQITIALQKDPYLSKNDTLTSTGEIVKAKIEASLTENRMNNMAFAFLDKIVGNMSALVSKTNNKEEQINNKVTLLMTLQNVMKKGGLENLQQLPPELVKATDVSWAALQDFQTNFNSFINTRLLEAGFDRTSKETRRKSIIEQSKYSKVRLAFDKEARDQSVIDVVPGAFENAFSYFDNQQNSQKFINTLIPSGDEPVNLEAIVVDNSYQKTLPNDTDIARLTDNLNKLITDIPADKNSVEAKQLKAKVMNNKIDKMLDRFGGLKDIVMDLLQWLDGSPIGKTLIGFFGKTFGLESAEMDKLLERPYIKQGVDNYMATIRDTTKMSNPPYKGEQIPFKEKDTDRKVKTEYFRNADNIVMLKEGNVRTCKQLDKNNALTPLDKNKDTALRNKYMKEENGISVPSMNINEFMSQDLNDKALEETVMAIFDKKYGRTLTPAEKSSLNINVFNILSGNTEQGVIQKIFETNSYIYSTEDMISQISETLLPLIATKISELDKQQTNTAKAETSAPAAPSTEAPATASPTGNAEAKPETKKQDNA